jgi:hypothetical protein
MIILGVDYHPSVQQVAFLDTETDWRKLRLLPEGRVNRKLSHSAKSGEVEVAENTVPREVSSPSTVAL